MLAPFSNRAYAMPIEVAIIVTDSPPLITLAVAQSLDYLLYPDLPVIIPNAVFHKATSAAGKLGAQAILDWYRAHTDQVRDECGELPSEIARSYDVGSSMISRLGA